MSFYDGVLGVVRLSAKIKPISDSTRMPILEFVGCKLLLGGSKKIRCNPSHICLICQLGDAIVAE